MGRRQARQAGGQGGAAPTRGHEAGSVILAALATLATVLAVVAATVPLLSAFGNQSERGRQRAAAQAMVDGLAGATATAVREEWPNFRSKAYASPCSHASSPDPRCPSPGSAGELAGSAVPGPLQSSVAWEIGLYDNPAPYAAQWDASAEAAGLEGWDANGDKRVWIVAEATVGGTAATRATLVTAPSTRVPAGWVAELAFETPDHLGAYDLAIGSDGNLWFTQDKENKIGKMTPSGEFTQYPLPTVKAYPRGITAGPDGNIWFTESLANQVGRITPSGEITEFPLGEGPHHPSGIIAGPDGNLWFVEHVGNRISKITTSGQVTSYEIPSPASGVQWLAAGPDGNIWFAEFNTGKIGKVTVAGEFTEYELPTEIAKYPLGIAAGPDGNVWFTGWEPANAIGRITPDGEVTGFPLPDPLSLPFDVVAGPDGNVWFTSYGAKKVGRVTPSGEVTHFPVPGEDGPTGLATGPEGNLWFTKYDENRIGRMSPGG